MTSATKLVVGASGFVGSHVARQLVERGDDVRVLIRRAVQYYQDKPRT